MIVLLIIGIFLILLFCYCCCVIAGQADDAANIREDEYYEYK